MMKKKKYRKSNLVCLAFLVYVTAMAVYLVPRNTEISDMEKHITVAGSYLIVFALWLLMRKKEKLADERRKEMETDSKQTK